MALMRLSLGPLDSVFGALAIAIRLIRRRRTNCARGIEGSTHNVVTNTRQVLDTAAADEDDGVLLKVVSLARNVRGNFHSVRQTNAAHLPKRRIGLLGGRCVDTHANTALLRAAL